MGDEPGSRWKPRHTLLAAGGIAVLILLFSLFREMGIVGSWKLYRTHKQVLVENAKLRDENRRLQEEVEKLKTNPSYIEEIARKELGLIGERRMSSSSTGKRMLPIHPLQGKDRAVRRYTVPALSLLHLLLFLFFRSGGGWTGGSAPWAVSAFAVLSYLVIRDLLTSRRRDRLPDVPAALAWGAAGILEMHVLVPAVADSRIVPAVLFPSIAFLLPGVPASVYAAAAFAWLLFSPDGRWPAPGILPSIGGMGALGLAAGRVARGKLHNTGSGKDMVQEAIDESRSLVLPWESPEAAADGDFPAEVERLGLLRSRDELMEGIQRILEGILPITGADRVLYVVSSPGQGRPFRAGASAGRGRESDGMDLAIPNDYVPVREAMLFRRAFFSEGDDAGNWAIGQGSRGEGGPTGVATAPVSIEEMSKGRSSRSDSRKESGTSPSGRRWKRRRI
jgi:cell division protein FtsB